MSMTTLVLGQSGSGKSTAIRNLNHEETLILSVLDKPLPFRGYRSKYNKDNKNYFVTDSYIKLLEFIEAVNTRRPEIKTLIIDDFQYLMAHEFMNRVLERGFDKYSELANHAWRVIKALTETRNDLHCFVLTHSDVDQHGNYKVKTIGKLLDDKITLEGMFTCVLHALVMDGNHKFLTQNIGTHIAKSPHEMFADLYIDNDLQFVREKMIEYFEETEE